MVHSVTLIAGAGPEIAEAVKRVFVAAGALIVWDEQPLNESILAQNGDALPPALVESVQRNRVALEGPLTTPIGTGYTSSQSGAAPQSQR